MNREDITALMRDNIRALEPYSTARDEFKGNLGIFLDANESPFGRDGMNRYPSSSARRALLEKVARMKGMPPEMVFLGNGSDESIDLCYRVFCTPGKDNAVIMAPSYGMYSVCADINDVERRMVPLDEDFSLPVGRMLEAADSSTKLMFVCSPNNPTGNAFPKEDILRIVEGFKGMVVLDEAYVDFSEKGSLKGLIADHPNLVILQTLSKAHAMAGLRIGITLASDYVVSFFDKVRYPYNIGADTLKLADMLLDPGRVMEDAAITVRQRERLASRLKSIACIEKVYPSDANFLLVKTEDPVGLYTHLVNDGFIVRDRSRVSGCEGTLRLTVGTPSENDRLLESIGRYDGGSVSEGSPATVTEVSGRCAEVRRETSETRITVAVDLDGHSDSSISTGLGFFDHMLWQIPHHSGISLRIEAEGDLDVDEHHTMEDVAIALGEALLKALGDRRGTGRYGFALPMDECEAMVLLDLGGRIDFRWEVPFTREYLGDTPTEMFSHFFKSLCESLKCNLHIKAGGVNNHHLAEAVFKAFARTLGTAVRLDPFRYDIPSSKGVL